MARSKTPGKSVPIKTKRAGQPPAAAPSERAPTPPHGHVFISYSRTDREYVNDLSTWLEGHGVKVWYDHDIEYGVEWQAALEEKLDTAAVVLLVMSTAARRSEWVDREIERAAQQRIPVFPVLLDSEGVVVRVADLQFCNVNGGRMPDLQFCQKLPGFLVSELDIAGALTSEQRTIAQRISSAVGPLRTGSKGPAVAALQVELLRVGLDPGPVNGTFAKQTAAAVREFQARRCHEPTADAMVGPVTWAILANSAMGDLFPSPATPPVEGSGEG